MKKYIIFLSITLIFAFSGCSNNIDDKTIEKLIETQNKAKFIVLHDYNSDTEIYLNPEYIVSFWVAQDASEWMEVPAITGGNYGNNYAWNDNTTVIVTTQTSYAILDIDKEYYYGYCYVKETPQEIIKMINS